MSEVQMEKAVAASVRSNAGDDDDEVMSFQSVQKQSPAGVDDSIIKSFGDFGMESSKGDKSSVVRSKKQAVNFDQLPSSFGSASQLGKD